jgi:hypothetical protein
MFPCIEAMDVPERATGPQYTNAVHVDTCGNRIRAVSAACLNVHDVHELSPHLIPASGNRPRQMVWTFDVGSWYRVHPSNYQTYSSLTCTCSQCIKMWQMGFGRYPCRCCICRYRRAGGQVPAFIAAERQRRRDAILLPLQRASDIRRLAQMKMPRFTAFGCSIQ